MRPVKVVRIEVGGAEKWPGYVDPPADATAASIMAQGVVYSLKRSEKNVALGSEVSMLLDYLGFDQNTLVGATYDGWFRNGCVPVVHLKNGTNLVANIGIVYTDLNCGTEDKYAYAVVAKKKDVNEYHGIILFIDESYDSYTIDTIEIVNTPETDTATADQVIIRVALTQPVQKEAFERLIGYVSYYYTY